jgi:heat shock protein HslJ
MIGTMERFAAVLFVGVLLMALIGCSLAADPLNGTQWKLVGWTLSSIDPADVTITATFADGKISGSGGVNSYSGPYKTGSGNAFSAGPLTATLMAGAEPAMRAEGAYVTLLAQAKSYKMADGRLTLYDTGRNESLIFEAGRSSADETTAARESFMNRNPEAKVRIDLKDVPAYSGGCSKRFHRNEHGEVVLDCGGDADIATKDGGKTWVRHTGTRLWPSGYFGPFAVGEELIAISENGYTGALLRRSSDEGRTWSKDEPIPPALPTARFPKLRGPYFFSVTATSKGRIIIPGDYLTGSEGTDPDILITHSSSDGGRTWQQSAVIEPPDPMPKVYEGFGEPAIAELPDGALWMVFRTVFGELWQCTSRDGGLTWGSPCPTGLASPLANPRVARVPGSDAVVLVWNLAKPGHSRAWGRGPSANNIWGPRQPLVFAISKDGCKTWSCPTVIHDGFGIYPNVHITETEMYVVYDFQPTPTTSSLGLAVYDLKEALKQPAWTHETITPYIGAGLVAPWLDLNIP